MFTCDAQNSNANYWDAAATKCADVCVLRDFLTNRGGGRQTGEICYTMKNATTHTQKKKKKEDLNKLPLF